MPRVNPVAANEIEIGQRLREARVRKLLTQTNLAIKLQIGRERLASYESGRAPLPARIGVAACEILGINSLWLACGAEPKWGQSWVELPDFEPHRRLSFVDAVTQAALVSPAIRSDKEALGKKRGRKPSVKARESGAAIVIPNTSVEDQDDFFSASVVRVPHDRVELTVKLRVAALAARGSRCECCGVSFKEALGRDGDRVLHIHHLRPLHSGEGRAPTIEDVLVLCPTCHELAHIIEHPSTLARLREVRSRIYIPEPKDERASPSAMPRRWKNKRDIDQLAQSVQIRGHISVTPIPLDFGSVGRSFLDATHAFLVKEAVGNLVGIVRDTEIVFQAEVQSSEVLSELIEAFCAKWKSDGKSVVVKLVEGADVLDERAFAAGMALSETPMKLTRALLFSLKEGAFLASNIMTPLGLPEYFEVILPAIKREEQWDRICAAGADQRACRVFRNEARFTEWLTDLRRNVTADRARHVDLTNFLVPAKPK